MKASTEGWLRNSSCAGSMHEPIRRLLYAVFASHALSPPVYSFVCANVLSSCNKPAP